MSDWENEDFEEPQNVTIPPKKRWDDEDVDDNDIKDSWEEEEEELDDWEQEEKPVKKKVPLAQKIAERKAAEEAKRLEEEEMQRAEKARIEEENKIPASERRRALELQADLENTSDLFSGVNIKDKETALKLDTMNPTTKEQFEEFSRLLVERIQRHQKEKPYAHFIENLVRELCRPLRDVECRKISSSISALASEKQREAKANTKTSKKKSNAKPSLGGGGAKTTLKDYDAIGYSGSAAAVDYDYDDDFM
ncbi:uncharacterized protein VTP21DRAFT_11590 [Calcarisporiella thermophila]|uniref:uncharacterized protein n=1 Tax=Calcarisporiella thermophila TaxID=911321 RepID=UPI003743DA9F